MTKENMHCSCIACITIDSVINFNKKNHPQVYLEECKYTIKKTQIPKFVKIELKSDSEWDWDLDLDLDLNSEVESKSDAKLMAKLKKSGSDSEWDIKS